MSPQAAAPVIDHDHDERAAGAAAALLLSLKSATASAAVGSADGAAAPSRRSREADVLCQPPSAVADIDLPLSASASALWAVGSVTVVTSICWVATRSARGPDAVGMVTVQCA
jgi:hypothetical protein